MANDKFRKTKLRPSRKRAASQEWSPTPKRAKRPVRDRRLPDAES